MPAEIIFHEKNANKFWQEFNSIAKAKQAGPSYTSLNWDWCLSISKARSLFISDKSFVYIFDKRPVAAVFLMIENSPNGLAGTMVGGYCYAPLVLDDSRIKEVFELINNIADEHKLGIIKYSIDSLFASPYNYLQRFGFLDTSILDYHIYTSGSIDDFIRGCRHGHKYDLKMALKKYRGNYRNYEYKKYIRRFTRSVSRSS